MTRTNLAILLRAEETSAVRLADLAVWALVQEAELPARLDAPEAYFPPPETGTPLLGPPDLQASPVSASAAPQVSGLDWPRRETETASRDCLVPDRSSFPVLK